MDIIDAIHSLRRSIKKTHFLTESYRRLQTMSDELAELSTQIGITIDLISNEMDTRVFHNVDDERDQ
jgi:hypothetical protein